VNLPVGDAASQTDIGNAIARGLAYLNNTQTANGAWTGTTPSGIAFPVASTAMAVLAFENNGHYAWNNLSDPYSVNVQKGLNWLLSTGQNITIDAQPAGNPDSNGNIIGICWSPDFNSNYQTPMALMALVASQTPEKFSNGGPLGNRTYYDIAVDIVDYLSWAQTETIVFRGGWGYDPNPNYSDNSNSPWVIMGLLAAESWGIYVPTFVKSELNYWITATQNVTGTPSSNNLYGSFVLSPVDTFVVAIPDTAAGFLALTYLGETTSNSSVIAAEGYINRVWHQYDGGLNVNIGSLYSMYFIKKACTEAKPSPITYISKYDGSPGVEWYNGLGEYADALVNYQSLNGSWINWRNWDEKAYFPNELSTALGILILEFGPVTNSYTLTLTVEDKATLSPIANATVSIYGPESHMQITGNDGQTIFNLNKLGDYQIAAFSPMYEAANIESVTVTANNSFTVLLSRLSPQNYTLARFTFSPSNPNVNGSIIFDGSNSTSSAFTTSYFWTFGDGSTATDIVTATHTYSITGNYNVTLTVASADGTDTWSQVVTVSEPQGDIFPWWWLLIVVLIILLILLLLLLRRRQGAIIIQTRAPVRCRKCVGDGNCDDCDLTPC
jgi:hypothetical protein